MLIVVNTARGPDSLVAFAGRIYERLFKSAIITEEEWSVAMNTVAGLRGQPDDNVIAQPAVKPVMRRNPHERRLIIVRDNIPSRGSFYSYDRVVWRQTATFHGGTQERAEHQDRLHVKANLMV